MAERRVALVVEDDPIARLVIVRTLADLPETVVLGVSTVAEARHVVESERIAVAVLDLQLPDGNGLEVLEMLRGQSTPACVVLASAFLQKYCSQAQIEEHVILMEKPIDPQELNSVIQQQMDPMRPELNPFSVPEYLQIACMGVHSLVLEVFREGGSIGTICIREGDVWNATDVQGSGEQAFRRLLGHQQVEVRCRPPKDGMQERQINSNWQHLLLDAARLSDEKEHDDGGFTDDDWGFFDDVPDPVIEEVSIDECSELSAEPTPTLSFDEYMENAACQMIASRLVEALDSYSAALRLRPQSRLAATNVARLRRLGIGS